MPSAVAALRREMFPDLRRCEIGSSDVLVKYKTEFNVGLKTAILGGNTSVEDSDAHGDAKP